MAKSVRKLLLATVILGGVNLLPLAHAEQPQTTAGAPELLVVQLPGVDREALVDLVTTLRSRLILRKQDLLQTVEESNIEGGDAILAAILPGGLLYAGIQKARHEQAREALDQVNAEIEQYTRDILAMQPGPTAVAIMQLP